MNIAEEIYVRMVAAMSGPVEEGSFRAAFDRARRAEAVFHERDMDLTEQELSWLKRFFVACREEHPLFGTWLSASQPEPGDDFPVRFGNFQLKLRNMAHTRTFSLDARLVRHGKHRAGFALEAQPDSTIDPPTAWFSIQRHGGFRPEEPRLFVAALLKRFEQQLRG